MHLNSRKFMKINKQKNHKVLNLYKKLIRDSTATGDKPIELLTKI